MVAAAMATAMSRLMPIPVTLAFVPMVVVIALIVPVVRAMMRALRSVARELQRRTVAEERTGERRAARPGNRRPCNAQRQCAQ